MRVSRSAGSGANIGAANVGRINAGTANFAAMHGTRAGRGRYAYRGHGYGGGGFRVYAFGDPDYYDSYSDDGNCYQRRLVPTPFGLRWRTIDICD